MEIDYDFNGSLCLTEVVEDFFYSPSTGLYVFRHPLVVDERVLEAADRLGIPVKASPEKWLVNTTLADALNLLKGLGSSAMSMPQYFNIRKDAIELGDKDMFSSLESDKFIELLATVFLYDKCMIYHPEVHGPLSFTGEKIPVNTPRGGYGWFHPDDVDLKTGLPTRIIFTRDIEDNTFKYWHTHTDIGARGALMAIRGYVTSVGKISLDLGFPADAISPKLTIRECRTSRPEGVLDERVLYEAKKIMSGYYTTVDDKTLYACVPEWCDNLLSFVTENTPVLQSANDVASQVLKEDIRDALGIMWTYATLNGEGDIEDKIRSTAQHLSGLCDDDVSDESFFSFIQSRKESLEQAVRNHESVVFVIGHTNPDTDTVVSAMAEAYRQHLVHGKESKFIPVVPGNKVPNEVAELFGDKLSSHFLLTDSGEYLTASKAGRPEWIMVDHNIGPEQPDTRAIIDHHYPSDVSLRQQIPRRIIFAGSTTALVAQRFYGLGLEIPPEMAKILHGAALMDTENRFVGKMTPLDELIMDRLQNTSGVTDESGFYQRLMRKLISCYDPEELFTRDYKEDWRFFGFAVAKGIGVLDDDKSDLVARLQELAKENNYGKNLPLTLLKIVNYAENAETITRERAYPVFKDGASEEFKSAVQDAITTIIQHESPPGVQIEVKDGAIEYWGVGTQLSRKKLAPVLDPVITAFNQYFYSLSTGLYFKRDFLRKTEGLEEIAQKHSLKIHTDKEDVVVGNPAELKFFLQELDLLCASPAEYFQAYLDAVSANDERMVAHLTSPKYLETLDLIVENKKVLVEHPEIVLTTAEFSYEGGIRKNVQVPVGNPGLIDPGKIDLSTGLPSEVEDPQQYGTGLWRYWSPDSDCAWALRSTIFAYDIPALDLKFRFDEALPRLSIRPCVKSVKLPKVKVYEQEGKIIINIKD